MEYKAERSEAFSQNLSEVKGFNNGLLVLGAIGDARLARPSSATLAVLNLGAHIEEVSEKFLNN